MVPSRFEWVVRGDGARSIVGMLALGDLGDPSRALVLLPTERMCSEAKGHLASSGGGITALFMTPRRLSKHIYDICGGGRPVIDLTTREMLVRDIMSKGRTPSLSSRKDARAGMVRAVARSIGELLLGSVTPEMLLERAESAMSKDLAKAYSAYLERLSVLDLLDPDMVPGEALKLIEAWKGPFPFDSASLHLLGQVDRSYSALISKVLSRCRTTIVMEHVCRAVPDYIPGRIGKAELSAPFDIPAPSSHRRSRVRHDGPLKCLRAEDKASEVRMIARYIKGRLAEGRLQMSRMAVVFPVRQDYDRLITEIFPEYGLPFDMGEDLNSMDVPSVVAVMDLLKAPAEGYPRNKLVRALGSPFLSLPDRKGKKIDLKDLETATRECSVFGGYDPESSWIAPMEASLKDPELDEGVKELVREVVPALVYLFNSLERLHRRKVDAASHGRGVYDVLKFLRFFENVDALSGGVEGAPALPGARMDQKGAELMWDSVRSMSGRTAQIGSGNTGFSEFLDALEMDLRKESLRSYEHASGITVMGLGEFAGLERELVVLGGATISGLPPLSQGFDVLTDAERSSLELPRRYDRRRELESLCISMCSSLELVISYHEDLGSGGGGPSRFLDGIELIDEEDQNIPMSCGEVMRRVGELADPSFRLYERNPKPLPPFMYDVEALLGAVPDKDGRFVSERSSSLAAACSSEGSPYRGTLRSGPVIAFLRDKFGPAHVWSVSRLERYMDCPYSFFVENVLNLEPLEEMEPGIPPEKKGTIFHSAAERFYDRWLKSGRGRISPTELPEAAMLMRRTVEEVLSSYPFSGPFWDALRDQLLGYEGREGLMDDFLRSEASYRGLFRVSDTELKFGLKGPQGWSPVVELMGMTGDNGPESFLLRGSIDRVDMLDTPEGQLCFIWDYKTGRSEGKADSIQVPLYLAAMRKMRAGAVPVGGGYYYVRRRGDVERDAVLGSGSWGMETLDPSIVAKEAQELSERIKEDMDRALFAIDGIKAGDFKRKERCGETYCQLYNMCRKGDDL